ncbi:hypothetical protein SNE40_009332 [Patella caerulea]|uniref:Uncharacterized protein n=1 Tax=Patella caerulea TaxID=87958 RepID=A0AAN8JYT5_PATCE
MEKPKSALLDMLSVTNTAVNSIGRSPTYKESDVTSQSSSVSQDSCKESVGSTTASEVLISSTYMRKTETTESQTNKSDPKVSHGSKPSTMDEKFERLKGEKYRLLKMLSCSDYDVEEETDEAEKKQGNQHVIIENASDSIITVPGRITNTNTRITNLPQQSDNDQYFTTNVQRTKNIKNSKELSDFSSELASGASSERSEKSSSVQDDVYIQKFHLSDKEKSLKQALGKRSSQSVPVKRVIQPKYVEKTIKETVTIRKDEVDTRKNGITDENLAATVAASAAAAVAHPFFQKEFEEKLSKTYGKVKDTSSSPSSNDRISELEKKVSALNEQRLDHIEKLQEYQMGIQAQLLSLPCKQRPCENFQSTQQGPYENIRSDSNRNRPYELAQERPHGNMNSELAQERPDENIPSRPTQDRPHGNTSVELKPVTPVVERKSSPGRLSPVRKSPKVSAPKVNPRNRSPPRQEVKYFPVKRKDPKRKPQTVRYEDKDDSPLSTPAHRTRVPTPTAYIDDPQHKLDPRLRNGGLLEEILDRNITPQRDSTFSVPDYPRTAYNR